VFLQHLNFSFQNAHMIEPQRIERTVRMQTASGNQHYVVVWDFESEVSGDVVRDGVVFSTLKPAKEEALDKFCTLLNYEFAPRVKPVFSRRLGTSGFIVGDVALKAVCADDPAMALQDALEGKGDKLEWSKD
jgi:hypothetical protein